MFVCHIVAATAMRWGAAYRIYGAGLDNMLVDMVVVRVVQMPVVEVVDVTIVADRRMTAVRSMLMRMTFVRRVAVGCHRSLSLVIIPVVLTRR